MITIFKSAFWRKAMKKIILILPFLLLSAIPLIFADCNGDELFCDDFNDGNADGWILGDGNWVVEGGEFSQDMAAFITEYNSAILGDYNWYNYTLEGDFKIISDTFSGGHADFFVYLNTNDSATPPLYNGYKFAVSRYAGGYWAVYPYKNSVYDSSFFSQPTPFPINLNQVYHVRIIANNSLFSFYLNNILLGQFTDDYYTSGKIGLATGQGDIHFDNVKVYSNNPSFNGNNSNCTSNCQLPYYTKEEVDDMIANLQQQINNLSQENQNSKIQIEELKQTQEEQNSTLTSLLDSFNLFTDRIITYITSLSNSIKKKMVCSLMEEQGINTTTDLGITCSIVQSQSKSMCKCDYS